MRGRKTALKTLGDVGGFQIGAIYAVFHCMYSISHDMIAFHYKILGGFFMSIIRVNKRENPFVMIDKTMLSDERLTWKAKGILAYLLSKPNDWTVRVADIVKRSKDGRDAVYNGIKELEKYGYIKREQIREKGNFKGTQYVVFERPQESETLDIKPFSPHPENPNTENPNTENPVHTNNDSTNNEFTNMDGWDGGPSQKNPSDESQAKKKWTMFRGLCEKEGLDERTTLDLWRVYQNHYPHVPITHTMAVLRDLAHEQFVNQAKQAYGLSGTEFRNFVGLFHHRMKTANEMAVAIEDVRGRE